MNVLTNLKTFFVTHKRKFVISGILVGSGYVFYKIMVGKLGLEKPASAFEKNRRDEYYESIEKMCRNTVLRIGDTALEHINILVNLDESVATLKKFRGEEEMLALSFKELNVEVFTRLCLTVYVETLLITTFRAQMAVVGGYKYKDLRQNQDTISIEEQGVYLSYFTQFLSRELPSVHVIVRSGVESALIDCSLSQMIRIRDLQQTFWAVQSYLNADCSFFGNLVEKFLRKNATQPEGKFLEELRAETKVILDNEEVEMAFNSCVCCGFEHFIDTLVGLLPQKDKNGIKRPASLPLAKMIPLLCKVVKHGGKTWLNNLIENEPLLKISADIYEAYCL